MLVVRALAALSLSLSALAQTFASTDGPIRLGPVPQNGVYTPASPYPSLITVPASITGTITSVAIRLRDLQADGDNGLGTQGIGLLLMSPDGRMLELMRAIGNGADSLNGVILTIADRNQKYLPDRKTAWPATSGAMDAKPTAFPDPSSPSKYVAPGPGIPAHSAAPAGTDSLASVFTGAPAAGVWKLFLVDHQQPDRISFSSWELILSVAGSRQASTTVLSSSLNPSFRDGAKNKATLTAKISGAGNSPTGTVLFRDGVNTIAGCASVPLSNTSSATCSAVFTIEGDHALTAVYAGTATLGESSSPTLHHFVKSHSTNPAPNQFCNAALISVPGQANTQPYPSVINVGVDTPPVTKPVKNIAIDLLGLSAPTGIGSLRAVLVAPDGAKSLEFLSGAGFSANQPPVDVTFSDSAATPVPRNGSLRAGRYQPTEYESGPIPSPPPPAPQVPASVANAKTFAAAFQGIIANGDWSLFLFDNGGAKAGAGLSGGWCMHITE